MFARLTILACFLAVVLSADPLVLFSDFGPNDSYVPGPGITVGCGTLCWANAGYSLAWAFTPTVTATLSTVETAAWSMFPQTTDLLVSITSDASGVPGSVLEDFSLPISPLTGLVIGHSSAHPVLSAGVQYWFAAFVPDLVNDGAQLGINPIGYVGPMANRVGTESWSPTSSSADAVFRITGDTAVPEPSSAWLVATVLGIVGTLRLKRI